MPLIRQLLLSLHRENTDLCVPDYFKPTSDTLDGDLLQPFHVPNAFYEILPHTFNTMQRSDGPTDLVGKMYHVCLESKISIRLERLRRG